MRTRTQVKKDIKALNSFQPVKIEGVTNSKSLLFMGSPKTALSRRQMLRFCLCSKTRITHPSVVLDAYNLLTVVWKRLTPPQTLPPHACHPPLTISFRNPLVQLPRRSSLLGELSSLTSKPRATLSHQIQPHSCLTCRTPITWHWVILVNCTSLPMTSLGWFRRYRCHPQLHSLKYQLRLKQEVNQKASPLIVAKREFNLQVICYVLRKSRNVQSQLLSSVLVTMIPLIDHGVNNSRVAAQLGSLCLLLSWSLSLGKEISRNVSRNFCCE